MSRSPRGLCRPSFLFSFRVHGSGCVNNCLLLKENEDVSYSSGPVEIQIFLQFHFVRYANLVSLNDLDANHFTETVSADWAM